MELFDKGVQVRMGQCHVKAWTPQLHDILKAADDVLGVESLATHTVPLSDGAQAYAMFQAKRDGCIKVILQP